MRLLQLTAAMAIASLLAGCATMRQQDVDAWVGVPIEALDTHSFFVTVPMFQTRTDSGIEIGNYANGRDVAQCFGNANASMVGNFVNANTFTTCSSGRIVCNNIFYIKGGKVIEFAPTGQCYTDETVQPQVRYLRLKSQ